VARGQNSKFLEIRAATTLARLWRNQGKFIQARDLLVPIYGWFTEGDTPVKMPRRSSMSCGDPSQAVASLTIADARHERRRALLAGVSS
jgi:hypothetical protein